MGSVPLGIDKFFASIISPQMERNCSLGWTIPTASFTPSLYNIGDENETFKLMRLRKDFGFELMLSILGTLEWGQCI